MKRSLFWISILFCSVALVSNTACNGDQNKETDNFDSMQPKKNNSESEPHATINPMDSLGAGEAGVSDTTKGIVSKEDKIDTTKAAVEAPNAGSNEQRKIDSIKAAKAKLKK